MYRKENPLMQILFALAMMSVVLVAVFALTRPSQAAPVAAYPVNSADDVDDGRCDFVHCSLREAINKANAGPGTDTIVFNIPGPGPYTIQVQPYPAMPAIANPVIIDGYSQLGASPNTRPYGSGSNAVLMIELDGANAGATSGLTILSRNSVVRGLVINRFSQHGIRIFGNGATGNVVEGNFIGTNRDGNAALGNGRAGVLISSSAANNTIGGVTPDALNVVSGNGGHGFLITGGATGNVVQGNLIGTAADAITDLGNALNNVHITGAASNNTIGGPTPGAGNFIANAGRNGIAVFSDDAIDNAILGNSLFLNGQLAIDLGNDGLTANDPGDSDSGPNNLQNHPLLVSAADNLGGLDIQGTLNSDALTWYTLDFFSSLSCDASGYGEGERPLGAATTFTDGSGDVSFLATLPVTVPAGQFITATATDPNGNTSEFSQCVPVVIAPISGLAAENDSPTVIGTPTTLTATVATGGLVRYEWALGDGSTGSGAVVSHVYPALGAYTATVTAFNPLGMISATTTISVVTDLPIIGLTAANDSPTAIGELTTLTANVTAGTNVSYTWAFGDGDSGSGAVAGHTYPALGLYTATVTATNTVSAITATTEISIVTNVPIEGLTAANDGPTNPGSPTTLWATITRGSNVSYTWAFGDGDNGIGEVVTHTYPASGVYTAVVTATNPVSAASASTQVYVFFNPPTGVSLTSFGTFIAAAGLAPWAAALAVAALAAILVAVLGRRKRRPRPGG